MAMADYDLIFHSPPGWTLLATGKPVPFPQPSAKPVQTAAPIAIDEQVSHWVSERPLPVAGFNLGKYVRGAAQAGNISVEAYATAGMERDFPKPPMSTVQIDPKPSLPQVAPGLIAPAAPSPPPHAPAVAEATARA